MELTEEIVSNRGERAVGTENNPRMLREHRDRYEFALSYIQPGMKVLDCACGTGYGSEILASKAQSVQGIDISPVAVAYAQKTVQHPGVSFREGSACALPLESGSIDAYCCFETLEHVEKPGEILAEAKRVLKPGGILLVSTPNRILTRVGPGERPYHNPHHFFELSLFEFDALLRTEFSHIQYFGQKVKSNSYLAPAYLKSKWRRSFRVPDVIPMRVETADLKKFDSLDHWQPLIFIAAVTRL